MEMLPGLLLIAFAILLQSTAGYGQSASSAAAAAAAASSASGHVICGNCRKIYRPVCGTDGRTYPNACLLRCISDIYEDHGFPAVFVRRRGPCPLKHCNCTNYVKPVCGTDGETYPNICYFNCENERRILAKLPIINIKHKGPCAHQPCICSDVPKPVCGSNNKTYRNLCVLDCVSRIEKAKGRPAIRFQHDGACKSESCICTLEYNPVCASDGVTYPNRCTLDCENRKRDHVGKHPLIVLHKGECRKCRCKPIYNPVCGSDKKTYPNRCAFDCENKRRKEKHLPLLTSTKGVCPCICTMQYEPVCATDGKTYGNPCMLKCENRRRLDLGLHLLDIHHKGRCHSKCYCSKRYAPVCASNGKTYLNKCWLDCNSECSDYPLYLVKYGPC